MPEHENHRQTPALTRVQAAKQASPKWAGFRREKKWERKLKSQSDDDKAALGRGILVRINSRIHLIRPFLIDDPP